MEADLGFLKNFLMVLSIMWEGNELRLRVSDSLLRCGGGGTRGFEPPASRTL